MDDKGGWFAMDLKGRHFLTLKDYTPEEIAYQAKWIGQGELRKAAALYGKSPYGEHLLRVAENRFSY